MNFSSLQAISPVDGRYRRAAARLADYFSEGALINYRVRIEIEYFIALCRLPLGPLKKVNKKALAALRRLSEDFTLDEALRVKQIEKVTSA
jgi:adenylosuccinate lyase